MSNFSNLKEISIIIPSLNPTERLGKFVSGLIGAGFDDVIIVDDGSDDAYRELFDEIGEKKQCTVLKHEKNMGKGVALKTAFRFFEENRKNKKGFLTADSDGQHLTNDVIKCAQTLLNGSENTADFAVIGTRDFKNTIVPARNALGNRITAFTLNLLFGLGLSDTQTGLRAFSAELIPVLLDIPGKRFDYETNMLLELKRRDISFVSVPIETVYEQGSIERSNFRPFIDSVMVFACIIKYALSSILCFVVDITAFALAMMLLGSYLGAWSILCCTVMARIISSFLNFNINKSIVFNAKGAYGNRFLRYYALAILQMLTAAGGLWLISLPFSALQPVGFITLLKALLDTILFFISFRIQRLWVFK